MKTAICGYSGSGKSTLAGFLAQAEKCPVLYLDQVQFCPGWQVREADEARAMVREFMKQDAWVIDGNYQGFFQEERLEQADRILLLLFGRFSCLWRILKRWFRYRNQTRESMAKGCREKLDVEFLVWILWKGRDRENREHMKKIQKKYSQKVILIRNQKQLDRFYQEYTEKGIKQ